MSRQLPLLWGHTLDSVIAYRDGESVSAGALLARAAQLAAALPARQRVINLCEDRYYFLLGFVAALLRDQTTLLPPNRLRDTIERLQHEHQGSYLLSDRPAAYAAYQHVDCTLERGGEQSVTAIPTIAAQQRSVILYTSGSSGEATPHPKSWEMLTRGAALSSGRLAIPAGTTLVATVPPQHMFGLETSVMLPLQAGCAIDHRRPLFPADIAATLASLPQPRALITTPLQLRACAAEAQSLPECTFILSATAPLSASLAQEVERLSGSPLQEIYGSTETGAIATRATAREASWLPLPGIELEPQPDGEWLLRAPHLGTPQPLVDRLQREPGETRFILLGRSGDLIKVAGKRVSLGDLNQLLLAIDGVEDGVFFLPQENRDGSTTRLAAIAVTRGLDEQALTEALRLRTDAAFLPRPLLIVEQLPRSESGKLPREALMQLLAQHKRSA